MSESGSRRKTPARSQTPSGRLPKTESLWEGNHWSEAAWQSQVLEAAASMGWKVMHIDDSRKFRRQRTVRNGRIDWETVPIGDAMAKGWPDLVLARGDRVLFRELKTNAPSSRLTPEQQSWLDALRAGGLDADVWRPRDYLTRVLPELGVINL